ncbi:MAG: hypothetical protein JWO96_487 [Candidatus Saccharibacteria bacterium]|nr:hypothetical protein [Candidatus Saccharibacteria bacterium]
MEIGKFQLETASGDQIASVDVDMRSRALTFRFTRSRVSTSGIAHHFIPGNPETRSHGKSIIDVTRLGAEATAIYHALSKEPWRSSIQRFMLDTNTVRVTVVPVLTVDAVNQRLVDQLSHTIISAVLDQADVQLVIKPLSEDGAEALVLNEAAAA